MGFDVQVYGEEEDCLEVVMKYRWGISPACSLSVKSRWKKGPPLEGAPGNGVLSEESQLSVAARR